VPTDPEPSTGPTGGGLRRRLSARAARAARWAVTHPGPSVPLLALVLTAGFLLVVTLLPRKPAFVFVEAQTETLLYRVARPEVAGLPLVDATVRTDGETATVATGLLQPAEGALVRYRWSPAAIAVELSVRQGSAGTLVVDEEERPLPAWAVAVFPHPTSADSPAARPLPIAGPAEIGAEFGAPLAPRPGQRRVTGLMRGGEVQVFGRAVLWFNDDALYPVTDFPLPAGGRLTGDRPLADEAGSERLANWYGLARIGDEGFQVNATTETDSLRLHRPGVREAETFGIGLLTRLFNDPGLAAITIFVVVFTVAMQMLADWLPLWRGK